MTRTAVVANGVVINVIVAEADLELDGLELVPTDEAGAGWTYVGGVFSLPIPVVPTPLDYPLKPYQFWAMVELSNLKPAIDAAVDQLPAQKRAVARAKFERMDQYDRDDALFVILAPSVGLTDSQIDQLWMQAKDL